MQPDLGLFGPDSITWRVHGEPVMGLAGIRALYLQALHPRAIAGVSQNSDYRADPWGRLHRTVRYVVTVIYGTTAQAQAAGRRIRAVHARLTAVDPDTGERYRVDEPDLLRWVHVTEVESFLTTGLRAGLRLIPAEIDRYYDEQRRSAELVGLDPSTVPGSAAEIDEYYTTIRPELHLTKDGAAGALFLAAPPLPWHLGLTPVRLAWLGVAGVAFGLLPAWARRMYGLPGLPTTDLSASLSVRALRRSLGLLPMRALQDPIHRDAIRRAQVLKLAGQPAR